MSEYQYSKDTVDLLKLEAEIIASVNISTNLDYSTHKYPNTLKIFFESDLTGDEQTALQTLVADHATSSIGEMKYLVKEYDPSGRLLIKETWYDTDNGDGTYSGKVSEISYTYNTGRLEKRREKNFWLDGVESKDKAWEYYVDGNEKVIEKLVGGI